LLFAEHANGDNASVDRLLRDTLPIVKALERNFPNDTVTKEYIGQFFLLRGQILLKNMRNPTAALESFEYVISLIKPTSDNDSIELAAYAHLGIVALTNLSNTENAQSHLDIAKAIVVKLEVENQQNHYESWAKRARMYRNLSTQCKRLANVLTSSPNSESNRQCATNYFEKANILLDQMKPVWPKLPASYDFL
jgi:tetratricopeptide (TPR) repeat protein